MKNCFGKFLLFLARLKDAHISYSLQHTREDTIMVLVAVPGERWEIEYFQDGSVEVEVFKSSGEMYAENKLDDLFANYSDY